MTMLIEAHDHLLRLTARRRWKSRRTRETWRVFLVDKRCPRCLVLASLLLRAGREFRARITSPLVSADGAGRLSRPTGRGRPSR